MCDCKKNNEGNGDTIALAFKRNAGAVSDVFAKYGMPGAVPTGELIIAATVLKGEPFLRDVSLAAAGLNPEISSYDDEGKANLAATIFDIIGSAADTGMDIAKGVIAIKNNGKAPANNQQQSTGQQVVYVPQPQQPKEPQRYFGFTGGQLALLAVAVTAVVVVVLLLKTDK